MKYSLELPRDDDDDDVELAARQTASHSGRTGRMSLGMMIGSAGGGVCATPIRLLAN